MGSGRPRPLLDVEAAPPGVREGQEPEERRRCQVSPRRCPRPPHLPPRGEIRGRSTVRRRRVGRPLRGLQAAPPAGSSVSRPAASARRQSRSCSFAARRECAGRRPARPLRIRTAAGALGGGERATGIRARRPDGPRHGHPPAAPPASAGRAGGAGGDVRLDAVRRSSQGRRTALRRATPPRSTPPAPRRPSGWAGAVSEPAETGAGSPGAVHSTGCVARWRGRLEAFERRLPGAPRRAATGASGPARRVPRSWEGSSAAGTGARPALRPSRRR